jgi:hypothetical protein
MYGLWRCAASFTLANRKSELLIALFEHLASFADTYVSQRTGVMAQQASCSFDHFAPAI